MKATCPWDVTEEELEVRRQLVDVLREPFNWILVLRCIVAAVTLAVVVGVMLGLLVVAY